MTFDEVYRSRLKELGQKMLFWVQEGRLTILAKSQIEILNTIYYSMKKRIEDLPEKEKKDLWETAKAESGHTKKKEQIKYAKAIYTLTELEKCQKEQIETKKK